MADGGEVEIPKHGRGVARLVPAAGPHALRARFTGVATTAVEDDEVFRTTAEYRCARVGHLASTDRPPQPPAC